MEEEQAVMGKYTSCSDVPVLVIGRSIPQNQKGLSKAYKIRCFHRIDTVFIQVKQIVGPLPVKGHEVSAHLAMGHSRILLFRRVKYIVISFHIASLPG